MPDPVSGLSLALSFIPAAAGLGTAAMGIVDSSKVLPGGGPSHFGFKYIEDAVHPFIVTAATPPGTPPIFGKKQIIQTLKSNWINGVNKPDQKATAKALIHMELTASSAPAFAAAAGVNATLLTSLATKLACGQPPTSDEVTVLGQFDVVLSAVLDDAYERGDQKYRNACKAIAMGVSVLLSIVASELLGISPDASSHRIGTAILIGLCATPLAPIAKDLATSLQSAASALGFVKG